MNLANPNVYPTILNPFQYIEVFFNPSCGQKKRIECIRGRNSKGECVYARSEQRVENKDL